MTWSTRQPRLVTTSTPLDTRGPKRLWGEPAGLVQRDRGDVGRLVRHDYRCPVHGVFELEVSSQDVPDEVACTMVHEPPTIATLAPWHREQDGSEIWVSEHGIEFRVRHGNVLCGLTSPWSPSRVGIWKSAGEVTG